MAEQHPNEVVRLTNTRNIQEAEFVRQALEDEGIECQIVGDYLSEMGLGVAAGAYPELWVRQTDRDRASDILKSVEQYRSTHN